MDTRKRGPFDLFEPEYIRKNLSLWLKSLARKIYRPKKRWIITTIYMKMIDVDDQKTAIAESTTHVLEAEDKIEANVLAYHSDRKNYTDFIRYEPAIIELEL